MVCTSYLHKCPMIPRHSSGTLLLYEQGTIAHLGTKNLVKFSSPLSLHKKGRQFQPNAGGFSTRLEKLSLGRQWEKLLRFGLGGG